MKHQHFTLTFLFLFTLVPFSFSQNGQCGTDQKTQEWISASPENQKKYESFLEQLTVIAETYNDDKLSKKKAVVTIPVVFHVMHNYGSENISKAQILEQMETLNKDFRKLNSDTSNTRTIFKGRSADFEVEFKLANLDPNGNCTDGITRTATMLTYGGDEDVKDLIRWDYKKYLNIWVISFIGRKPETEGSIIAGYSRFPFDTDASTDGIIIDHRFVGSTGTSSATVAGRTLTHEIGHWLGLLHPFQNGCGGSNCSNSGDRICDTPPVAKASSGCPIGNNSCSNDSPDELDNVENFMDYANGNCTNMFTAGQKAVAKYFLGVTNNGRGSNVSASNMTATGAFTSNPCAPKADFHTTSRAVKICQGASIAYADLSWNGEVTDRVWTFEGGSPSSSTFASPLVVYNSPGKYKVTLKVTNSKGESEISKTDFIEVLPAIANLASPFEESFDNAASPALWSSTSTGDYGWKILKGPSHSGGYALVGVINENTPINEKFYIYSPAFDLNAHKNLSPKLSMRVAYSLRQTGAGERIVISGSNDCGITWLPIKGLVGASNLKSVSGNNPGWSPKSTSDWIVVWADLNQQGFQNSRNLMLRFELTSAAGNSVYIDDININQFVLSTPIIDTYNARIHLFPNPNQGSFVINSEGLKENINIELYDPLGKLVRSLNVDGLQNTQITVDEPGIYMVHLHNQNFTITRKVVVTN